MSLPDVSHSTAATAPGKIILFGEHAVVYGQPAIAAPLAQRRAVAMVSPSTCAHVRLVLPDIDRSYNLARAYTNTPDEPPLVLAIRLVQAALGAGPLPPLTITVRSELPIASGLGSGAATAVAVIRALWHHLAGAAPAAAVVSRLAYEVEKVHHGTPSGIDNTVIAYEQPVYFRRAEPENVIEPFAPGGVLHLVVADTGVRSQTRLVVGDVRAGWQADRARYAALFDGCGRIATAARAAIEAGDAAALGSLMDENQVLLERMGVSSAELETLCAAALTAGALGAKLSGAGRGGNMIALARDEAHAGALAAALARAGARAVIETRVR